ncbi:extracellular serine/threonine protein kinase FAM20C-like [Plectropomus leopardus]|uniref:extracellular serine/threonine protein kinase FAM20C-like n=1 Tax=Plectropomus leopardus TaxID=160734 RepID=UPI001C4B2709|nr:extracellular serine/threonine protein kinase FAM20C-like [Plectropomus leopardus]
MRRMRCRSRTICLSLAFITIFLHLLLAFVSLPIYYQPCDPLLPPRTHILRDLALNGYTSVGISGPAESPTDAQRKDYSDKDANKDAKGHVQTPSAVESGLSKLEALFDHPLYNMPSPPIPEDDWLLKMKPKIKESEKSSLMWVSGSQEGYENVQWNSSSTSHPPWLRFHLGISRWQLYPHPDPNMESLTQQLATHRIVSAVQKSGGTQLKLVMSFPNYGQAMFKPMKQERDEETNYDLYYFSDFERHNAEIAAFHLDRILGYRRVPPVVGRLVDVVKEIKDVTTDRKLARTFFSSPVGSVCFYGQCTYYCSTEHAVCGRPRDLEASLAVMLPDLSLAVRRSWRSPWRRSYSRSKLAKWETEPDYCSTVKKTPPYNKGTRLVDFMDLVILDFLMSNMDRHHYETFEKFGNNTFLVHLDNGRAFGRHSKDEPSILVPLEQCCRIRRSTWLRLRLLSLPQYRLSDVMRTSLSQDPLHSVAPLLSEPHLAALDRRLKTVLETVSRCQKTPSEDSGDDVIYDDISNFKDMVTPAG